MSGKGVPGTGTTGAGVVVVVVLGVWLWNAAMTKGQPAQPSVTSATAVPSKGPLFLSPEAVGSAVSSLKAHADGAPDAVVLLWHADYCTGCQQFNRC